MAAQPSKLSVVPGYKPIHNYYAEADVLSASLEHPLQDKVKPRAQVTLDKNGHYQFRQAEPFRVEGILSYKSGYTQVAGYPSSKSLGFSTLSTSVLEGLNVLDVITADRVVAQISTVHPFYDIKQGDTDQVPSVTFLGTRFDNLRIDGHKVEVKPVLNILGPKPKGHRSYFEDRSVLGRISGQHAKISAAKNLPKWAREEYPKGRPALNWNGWLECSLVSSISGAPGTSVGHFIDLPHFGKIFLGELKVEREPGNPDKEIPDAYKFHLTMIRLEMGCLAEGRVIAVSMDSNGRGGKGGGG
jgi:hypothetical protein